MCSPVTGPPTSQTGRERKSERGEVVDRESESLEWSNFALRVARTLPVSTDSVGDPKTDSVKSVLPRSIRHLERCGKGSSTSRPRYSSSLLLCHPTTDPVLGSEPHPSHLTSLSSSEGLGPGTGREPPRVGPQVN